MKVRRLRVMIVEDDRESALALAELMEMQGFDTRIAVNGSEAIRKANEFLPDVILLDIGLPVMNGYEVARELRLLPDSSTALIVAVTGYGASADREKSTNAGIDLHMTKPVDVAFLKEILKTYRQELME